MSEAENLAEAADSYAAAFAQDATRFSKAVAESTYATYAREYEAAYDKAYALAKAAEREADE